MTDRLSAVSKLVFMLRCEAFSISLLELGEKSFTVVNVMCSLRRIPVRAYWSVVASLLCRDSAKFRSNLICNRVNVADC